MKVVAQICLYDQLIRDDIGNELALNRGEEYLTTPPKDGEDEVTLLSSYWAKVPAKWFGGAI